MEKVTKILILSSTSRICHHHNVITNMTVAAQRINMATVMLVTMLFIFKILQSYRILYYINRIMNSEYDLNYYRDFSATR